ncbi:MAG: DegT/DnrJ/EryC1/StrS family aminotransferase [bacterium]|nr:DegT/DnrJ/EryC1/StrS family aminotransferase [bacterium]
MNVPLVDMKGQYNLLKKEINMAVLRIVESGMYIGGKEVEKFEEELARHCNAKYAIGVSSGTDALYLALRVFDIGPGDEVISVPFTFMATTEAICLTGATPVFVDIDPKNFNMDASKIEKAITKKTRAIMPVHLYGQAADMDPIMKIAKKYKLVVIEDAAQAIGSEYKGKQVGSIGDIGTLSFFPSKNLGACGDAGAILTNRKDLIRKLKMLREHGSEKKYYHEYVGTNSRLDALQAAVLSVKLKYLDGWTKKRRELAKIYDNTIKPQKNMILPAEEPYNKHIYNQYTLRVKKREILQKFLQANGISSISYYPLPMHLQKAFKFLKYEKGDFPESEKAAKEVLSIPIWPELGEEKIKFVSEKIIEFWSGHK